MHGQVTTGEPLNGLDIRVHPDDGLPERTPPDAGHDPAVGEAQESGETSGRDHAPAVAWIVREIHQSFSIEVHPVARSDSKCSTSRCQVTSGPSAVSRVSPGTPLGKTRSRRISSRV